MTLRVVIVEEEIVVVARFDTPPTVRVPSTEALEVAVRVPTVVDPEESVVMFPTVAVRLVKNPVTAVNTEAKKVEADKSVTVVEARVVVPSTCRLVPTVSPAVVDALVK